MRQPTGTLWNTTFHTRLPTRAAQVGHKPAKQATVAPKVTILYLLNSELVIYLIFFQLYAIKNVIMEAPAWNQIFAVAVLATQVLFAN